MKHRMYIHGQTDRGTNVPKAQRFSKFSLRAQQKCQNVDLLNSDQFNHSKFTPSNAKYFKKILGRNNQTLLVFSRK